MNLSNFVCIFQIVFLCTGCCLSEDVTFVDPELVLVPNFEGWGTSLAWWAEILGGHKEDVRGIVTKAFFSPDALNLNIVRYVIGGTTPGISSCDNYRPGSATESYQDGLNMEFNWERDPRQRIILTEAKRLGADTFEAFSNSPPDWMTISKCSNGNPLGGLLHNNLDILNATYFADYATEVIRHFHEEWDITFQTFAPFNEPSGLGGIGGWIGPRPGSQEGCNLGRNVMVQIIKSVHENLSKKGMDYVRITTADETQVNTATATQQYFRKAEINHMIEKVNVHGYWDMSEIANRRDLLRKASQLDGHRLWMDEMGWGQSPLNDMTQGLNIANRILRDFKKLLPSAWVYWQVMEDIGEWGLLGVPYIDATVESIVYYSGYYSMMQFSKYIKKGYSIVNVNNDKVVAAFDPDTQILVLVIVNSNLMEVTTVYDLSLFKSISSDISATRTSASEQNVKIQAPILMNLHFNYTAPAESITTILFHGASSQMTNNLIINGDFENNSTDEKSWALEVGNDSSGSGGISDSLSWNGNLSGFLNSQVDEVSLTQTIKSPTSTDYYLSAWCFTNGHNTKLGVKINGIQGPESPILIGIGYQSYGFRFHANSDDDVKIHFTSSGSFLAPRAYIDDVVLHSIGTTTTTTDTRPTTEPTVNTEPTSKVNRMFSDSALFTLSNLLIVWSIFRF